MRNVFSNKWKLIPVAVVFLFFAAYILVGISIYKDYGVSTDEQVDYKRGQMNYQRLMGGSDANFQRGCSLQDSYCSYPPFFSMLLYWFAPSGDSQSIYWRRHQFTFAFFVLSVFFFFLIGKKIFKDWKIGLLGCLFLIISPRIFAQSFYNPKDIPFLGAYIISIYTLLLFLERKNIFTAILHGIAIGVVCSIRIPGLVIIPITFFFYFFDLFLAKENWKSYLNACALLLTSLIITAALIYFFSPSLYTDPIANFIRSFNIMRQYPWNDYQLFMGKNITNQIPWQYSIVWFSVSSPVFYVLLFILGSAVLFAKSLKSRTRQHLRAMRDLYLVGTCGVLPIVVVILMKSVLYTDNRQMYFVYPPLLLISLYGFKVLIEKIRQKTLHWQLFTAIILIAGLAYPIFFMVRYHPYQYTYFNFLAGTKMSTVKQNFGLDTWGLSVMNGLQYIAKTDSNQKINVEVIGHFKKGWLLLPAADRKRLNIKDEMPDYIIDTYRYYPIQQVSDGKIVYSIQVGDTDILTVYKLDGN
jgi:hypothetical protein